MKRQFTYKMPVNLIYEKEIVSRIYKEHLQVKNTKGK